jgi:uncharacterized protein YbjT (DUF2867 family)
MYLVTGSTGNIGSKVAAALINQGEEVRLFVRDAKKVEQWKTKADVVTGDFGKPESFRPALAGVRGVFLMNRGADRKTFGEFAGVAREEGVKKIVFLSTLAAANPALTIGQIHKEQEDAVRASGLTAKILRPGGFMSNTFGWIGSIKTEGKVYNAMGCGRFAPVAPEDIAAVAVRALTGESPDEIYNISGSDPATVSDQVRILSQVIGKNLECVDISEEAAVQGMMKSGLPEMLAAAVVQSFRDIRAGKDAPVFDTVERVTGRKPITFRKWAEENAARFA